MSRTLYEILEIPEGATSAGIKDAYRRLAMKWHPDRNPDNRDEATERFKQIGYAYKVLSDSTERANYDESLREQRQHESRESAEAEQEGYEDFSGAAAQQMFFEQMLDLAVELAARGFGQDQIVKTLLSLDCPEAIARAAAVNAVKVSGKKTSDNSRREGAQRQQASSIEQLEWDEAEPFYAAVIGGVHATERMNEDDYLKKMSVFKRQRKWLLISFASLIVGVIGAAVVTPIVTSAPERYDLLMTIVMALAALGFLGILGVLGWRLATESAIFRRERTIRYYLTAFECFHDAKPLALKSYIFHVPALFFTGWWMAYRRMTGYALLMIVTFAAMVSAMWLTVDGIFQTALLSTWIFYPIAAVISLLANKTYFKTARRRIQPFISLPKDRALAKLREVGGVSSWSGFGFLALYSVLLMPAAIKVDYIGQVTAGMVNSQVAAQTEAVANEQREFDLVVVEMEARHPEFVEKHPRYDQALVDDAIARMESYVKQGNTRSNALRLAVADMEREADAARPAQQ